ncbi:MAG TPA: hypothetical protein VGO43_07995 [Pyrinomonadaceae bacterium]|nr:hypothetical protein [Pyrinomonadaceae bacterium]
MIKPKNATVALALACVLAAAGCIKTAKSSGEMQPQRTRITSALPDNAFMANLTPADPPANMRAGEQKTVTVRVKNASQVAWPADSPADGKGAFTITLRDRWLSADGNKVVNDVDGGTPMVYDLLPGGELDLPLKIAAPKEKGNYVLEFDMVQEQVSFFREKGSTPARINVKVE